MRSYPDEFKAFHDEVNEWIQAKQSKEQGCPFRRKLGSIIFDEIFKDGSERQKQKQIGDFVRAARCVSGVFWDGQFYDFASNLKKVNNAPSLKLSIGIYFLLHKVIDYADHAVRIDDLVFDGDRDVLKDAGVVPAKTLCLPLDLSPETLADPQRAAAAPVQAKRKKFVLNTPPVQLPDGHQYGRDEVLSARTRLLKASSENQPTTIALVGMGGNGKTAVAEEISSDPEIREAFPGGVLWLNFGFDASFTVARAVAAGLGKAGVSTKDLDLASDQMALKTLAEGLDKKPVLVVHDDVWRMNQLPGLPAYCTRLITTRVDLIAGVDEKPVSVGRLPETAAYRLLAYEIRIDGERSDQRLRRLAVSLRGWTLLLRLVNDELRAAQDNGQPLSTTLDDFEAFVDEHDISALDQTHGGHEAQELRRIAVRFCLDYGFDALSENERRVFYNLGIIPQGVDMPVDVACDFARHATGVSGLRAKTLLKQFSGRSIFRDFDWQAATFRMHDEFWAYFRTVVEQEGRWTELHGAMLSALGDHCSAGWSTLDQEHKYGWTQLLYHLREVGDQAQVDGLRTDYGWLRGKLDALGALELYQSFLPPPKNTDTAKVGRSIALSLPIIAKRKEAFALQMYGRLGHEESKRFRSICEEGRKDVDCYPLPLKPHLYPLGAQNLTVEGGTGSVTSATFSADGTHILSSSYDGTARLWDAATGEERKRFEGHDAKVWTAVFSSDCTRVLTCSNDDTARLWDVDSGEEIQRFQRKGATVKSAIFCADRACVLTVSREHSRARLWDMETGDHLQSFETYEEEFFLGMVSPDGARILAASIDSYDDTEPLVRFRDGVTGRKVLSLYGLGLPVCSAVFSSDGSYVLTGSVDATARLWDVSTGAETGRFEGHRGSVNSAVFSPDGGSVLTASDDHTARLWDIATGEEVKRFEGHSEALTSAVFSSDGARILTASNDGTMRLWDRTVMEDIQYPESHSGEVVSAVFSPSGSNVLTASHDGTARLWDTSRGEMVQLFEGHSHWVTSATFSADGRHVLTSSGDMTARLWEAATGTETARFEGHRGGLMSAILSSDGTRALTASLDCTARLWDVATAEEVNCFRGHSKALTTAVFSADNSSALTASWDHTARVWEVSSGKEISCLVGHRDVVGSAVFSSDGFYVLTASKDCTARLWKVATGEEIKRFEGHSAWIRSAVFSKEGARVLTAADDLTARVWDASTSEEIHRLEGHRHWLTRAVFSSDGTVVIAASEDRTVRLWKHDTGENIATVNFDFYPSALGSTGDRFAVGDSVGGVHVFRF